MTNRVHKLMFAGMAVAGALAFSAPAMAGGCIGGHAKTTTTITADTSDTTTGGQSKSSVLTQSTKTVTGG